MKFSIIGSALVAAALLLCADLSLAAESAAPGDAKKGSATEKKAPPGKAKVVDINSAGKEELKTLPGIDDAKAEKIIAGRPYLSKAHLVTRKIIPHGEYEVFKRQIIALQKSGPAAKPGKK